MRVVLTQTQAMEAERSYASAYDVAWFVLVESRKLRAWWWLTVETYYFNIDTGGQGSARAYVGSLFRGVELFEFRPHEPTRFWLPPWAAFPRYSSATMGWRQGSGEVYLTEWFRWFTSLSEERKASYKERFPEPSRDGWPGFYGWGNSET